MTKDLSIIIPYHQGADLSFTIPYNIRAFANNKYEVIISMWDDSEAALIIDVVKEYDYINWRLFYNKEKPTKGGRNLCVNAGLRQAKGRQVLVMQPEQVVVNDNVILDMLAKNIPVATKVVWTSKREFITGKLEDMVKDEESQHNIGIFAPRKLLIENKGYKENTFKVAVAESELLHHLTSKGIAIKPSAEPQFFMLAKEWTAYEKPPVVKSVKDNVWSDHQSKLVYAN